MNAHGWALVCGLLLSAAGCRGAAWPHALNGRPVEPPPLAGPGSAPTLAPHETPAPGGVPHVAWSVPPADMPPPHAPAATPMSAPQAVGPPVAPPEAPPAILPVAYQDGPAPPGAELAILPPTAPAGGEFPAVGPTASPPTEPAPSGEPIPPAEQAAAGEPVAPQYLELPEVTRSVYYAFPAIEAALRERGIAQGQEIAAWGAFDMKLKADGVAAPMGFYQNYRSLARLERPLYTGGGVFGQYRTGEGNFPPWYGERETNDGGEFKLGAYRPFLRDRAIDQRRAELLKATLRRQAVEPFVQAQVLGFTFLAADAYWNWVAAGRAYQVQLDLLEVTVDRNRVYEARVAADDLARIELVQNERLIATRQEKLVEAERKWQQSAIKLSLYLRNEAGEPVLPPPNLVPPLFPEPTDPDLDTLPRNVVVAIDRRPELRELAFLRSQAAVDRDWGQNQVLPTLDAGVEASQDVGGAASPKKDKSPFELEAGVYFNLPLERRKALGKIREAESKLAAIAAKRVYVENKISLEVQDAYSALKTAYDRVLWARRSVVLARELERAERERFEAQDSDLLRVALQEAAAIEAALQEIEALRDYHIAVAAYRAALADDPLTPSEIPATANPLPLPAPPGPDRNR